MRILIFIGMAVYAISPIDLCPGPIDDLIILVAGYIAQKRLAVRENS